MERGRSNPLPNKKSEVIINSVGIKSLREGFLHMRYNVEVVFHKDFIEIEGDRIIVGLLSQPRRGKANLLSLIHI